MDGRGRRCKAQHDNGKDVEHCGRPDSGRVNRSRRNRRTEDTSYSQSNTGNGLRRTLRRTSKSLTCNGQSSSNSNCTTPDTSTESGYRKIPGYYYDPVKNRYFKTSQDHTENSLVHDQSETVSRNSECLKSNRIPQTRLHHFRKRELTDAYNPVVSLRRDLEDWARRMVEKNHFTHDHPLHHPCPDFNGFISNVALSSNCRKMVAVIKLSGMEGCNMFHELYNVTYDNEKFVKPKMFATVVSGEVSHVEWNPDKNMENFLLLSSLGSGNSPGSGVICKFSESSTSSLCLLDHYPLARGTAWHCSWCQNPQYSNLVGVAGSEQAMLIDVEKKTKLCRIGSPSDIFSVEFAHKSPVIFFGRRSGDILRVDIRATRKRTYIGPKQHSSMTCVKMMEDENYLMASNYDGMIKMWDVRLSKAVKEYRGNVNEAKLIRFVMDSSQSIIASAGLDGKTRIWSVGSCKLLNTIDRPGPNCKDFNVPALCLAENWGNKKGLMALGITSSDKLYFYY